MSAVRPSTPCLSSPWLPVVVVVVVEVVDFVPVPGHSTPELDLITSQLFATTSVPGLRADEDDHAARDLGEVGACRRSRR